ncbi:hypothetical protein AVEN_107090-1, partial [Araneus ventricosus]
THPAFSTTSPKWSLEKEIIALKIRSNISFPEACKMVVDRTPKSGVSYSSVLKA